ncbi:hypothetical protein [Actinocrispum sp. NPDC049592]|uniref:Rv0361 family membrane protein n=1 Tax=Actinocrispum sp. NPDC049592 TaxID=3154835 RepID=UPI00342BCDAF
MSKPDVAVDQPLLDEEVAFAPDESPPTDRSVAQSQSALEQAPASPSRQDGAARKRRVALVWGGVGVVVAGVVAVVLVLVGQQSGGGGATPRAEGAPATVVAQEFVDAITNKNPSGVLAVLCVADRESVERNGFPVADVNAVLNSVEVDSGGATATLNVTFEQSSSGDHTQATFPMVKESGEWRICQIGTAPPSS